ncbi:LysM peptidoglycan-binding domain-containing protein [Candidatus Saccharibacteria bacterium]|nr:LysM peptidoglycan-binding domain-containing protein [Candidatus Saccharibacteria bacterium]MBH2007452.1 LysM peptidoglycan-binding domain-containing protein [Candidatus Saccharibacteria bacterium]
MKIRSSLTAIAVVFSVALFFAPAANAAEQPKSKTDEKPAATAPVKVAVQAGDTLEKIAAAHGTTYVQLYNANPEISNPDLIDVGNEIRIPANEEQLPDRYGEFSAQQAAAAAAAPAAAYVAEYQPVYSQTFTPGSQPVYATDSAGNTYFKGYCTWYAKDRRPDLPNMLGNGGQWVANAAAQGYSTGNAPRVGAIAETSGHVAYVEAVNADGTITISEMNGTAGFGAIGSRNVPAGQYNYIY